MGNTLRYDIIQDIWKAFYLGIKEQNNEIRI